MCIPAPSDAVGIPHAHPPSARLTGREGDLHAQEDAAHQDQAAAEALVERGMLNALLLHNLCGVVQVSTNAHLTHRARNNRRTTAGFDHRRAIVWLVLTLCAPRWVLPYACGCLVFVDCVRAVCRTTPTQCSPTRWAGGAPRYLSVRYCTRHCACVAELTGARTLAASQAVEGLLDTTMALASIQRG